MVFSLIKERTQIIAEELCRLKKYELYKDLMKEVRSTEALINKFQNQLRQDVHKKELDDYQSIGYEIQKEFNNNWDNVFEKFKKESTEEYKTLDMNVKKINDLIFQKESNRIHNMKIKPSHKIKMLHNQEKLVAINERIEEAANFRNELKHLVKKDEARLEKEKNEKISNLNNKLEKDEKMELKKKADRIEKEQHKLIINKYKATDVLNKQINLHIKDITRIQNSISNIYLDKGKKMDEMKRSKARQNNTNKVLSSMKAIKSVKAVSTDNLHDLALALLNLPSKNLTLNSSMESTGMSKLSSMKKSMIALKYIIRNHNFTRWDINTEFGSRKFCNVDEPDSVNSDNNLKLKIRKLLDQRKHKDEIMIPPHEFYDDNLEEIIDAQDYRDILPRLGNSNNNNYAGSQH